MWKSYGYASLSLPPSHVLSTLFYAHLQRQCQRPLNTSRAAAGSAAKSNASADCDSQVICVKEGSTPPTPRKVPGLSELYNVSL